MTLVPGARVAHYTLVEQLGEGGMGVVFRAHDTRLDRHVALKFIAPHASDDEESRARFMREARSAAALDHPAICAVHEIGDADGLTYLAMTFVEGRPLADLIAAGPLEVRTAVLLAVEIGEGLAVAHGKGIVHRDVKSGNVMVTPDGRAKILDFGLARSPQASPLTRVGAFVGTPAYMAPERLYGEESDHRGDIWALGVLLYEMLAGRLPFRGDSTLALMWAISNTAPEPVSAQRREVPLGLEHVLNRALAKEVVQRYQRVADLVADLRALLAGPLAAVDGDGAGDPSAAGLRGNVPASEPPTTEALPERPVRVLLVDDEPDLELLMRQHFRKHVRAGDVELIFAGNGREALAQLEQDRRLGIVFTDIRMPEMDGLTLLTRLGAMDRPLKVVIVSAFGDLANIRTAMNRGAFDFVTKPIDLADFEATLTRANRELRVLAQAREAHRRATAMQQELDVARRIQEGVLPRALPPEVGVEAYGYTMLAREVGGDFHDVFLLDEHRVVLTIGEVFGSGVAAALLAAVSRTLIKALVPASSAPGTGLMAVSRMLREEGLNALSVSAYVALLDPRTGTLRSASAGHLAPMLLRADGAVEPIACPAGPPLGSAGAEDYGEATRTLAPGDGLFLFTDGLPDATDADRRRFTLEGVQHVLRASAGAAPSQAVRAMVRALDDFLDGAALNDDVTALAVRLGDPAGPGARAG